MLTNQSELWKFYAHHLTSGLLFGRLGSGNGGYIAKELAFVELWENNSRNVSCSQTSSSLF